MSRFKLALFGSSIVAVASISAPALAQAPAGSETAAAVEEIVVTGSRLVRDGYQAPTPVTVVETATLQQSAPTNIPDGLNQLPQFSGSRSETQNNQAGTAIAPNAGNYLNLRNLGIVRSLILLDGMRVPPTSYEGTVDTNVLPQSLIQRVDVVTAGASAAYGSDALTGVVNFILDKQFTGLKGSVQGGITEQGDRKNYRLTLAGGQPVLDGRGHVLFSLEHYMADGIKDRAARPLMNAYPLAHGNGTTIPFSLRYNTRVSNSTFGGMLISGPLAFNKFEADGRLTPFNRGAEVIGGVQIGGDGSVTQLGSLIGAVRTDQAFARASYDFTDNVTGFVQMTFGEARNRYRHVGNDSRFGNLRIFTGNAFLRPEVQARFTATGADNVQFSRHGFEGGPKVVDMLSNNGNLFAGLEGRFGGDWTWRATYSGGLSIMRAKHSNNPENTRLVAALDAVRDPATNTIVCRVTLTNPGQHPGCVPLNFFGVGAPSQQALDYVYRNDSQYEVRNDLHSGAFHVAGTLFELPAGPLSVAAGAEYRTQSLVMTSNADPAVPLNTTGLRGFPTGQGRFGNTNQGVADGSQKVLEGFAEIAVPLLSDLPFIESLEFNGAARVTDYSTSGRVETWKAGFSYVPFTDLRVRATMSRDIRAPTLNELFAGAQLTASTFTDIHINDTVVMTTVRSGNANLVPEIGNTQTIGMIYSPSWLQGFTASIDYYKIDIEGAITLTSAAQQNQDCEDSNGTAPVCSLIVRPLPFSNRTAANAVQRIQVSPLNLSETYTHGIDFEAGYRMPLSNIVADSNAVMTFRVLANYAPSYKTKLNEKSAPLQQAGLAGAQNPKLRTVLNANYVDGPLTVNLQRRHIGELVRSYQANIRYENNDVPSVAYYNLAISYKFDVAGAELETFLNVNNLFDKDPPLVPYTNQPGLLYPTLQGLYDILGRAYTTGIRFRF